jgi:hypothetical protein
MKTLRFIGLMLLTGIMFFILFIVYSTITYYDPPQRVIVAENIKPDTIPCNSVLSVISWNIGYAGLGDNMDFFYDSGKKVRDTRRRTITNLDSINSFVKQNSSSTFFLIQEIDLHSKRSYFINERDTLISQTAYHSALAQTIW